MMTPSRPYLIRGLYEWITDNSLTPHLLVDATVPGTVVPTRYVKDDSITLNISKSASKDLRLGNDAVEFQARFGAKICHIYLPIPSIKAIYAYESNQGMEFSPMDIANYDGGDATGDSSSNAGSNGTKKPHLEIVE